MKDYVSQIADAFIARGWQKDQFGQWFNPNTLERTDFNGALQSTVRAEVEAEVTRRLGTKGVG